MSRRVGRVTFGDRGLTGNICARDYGSFFEQAVGLIDTACDEFEPEGRRASRTRRR